MLRSSQLPLASMIYEPYNKYGWWAEIAAHAIISVYASGRESDVWLKETGSSGLISLVLSTQLRAESTEACLAAGMRVILDPHIMTRTSSHEPNQLIHGPHPTPPPPRHPLCLQSYHRAALRCRAVLQQPTFPCLITCSEVRAIHISLFTVEMRIIMFPPPKRFKKLARHCSIALYSPRWAMHQLAFVPLYIGYE